MKLVHDADEISLLKEFNEVRNIWYDGKNGFVKSGIDITPIFKEEYIGEYDKCFDSCEYFIENFIRIRTLDHGIQPMSLRDYQLEQVKLFLDYRFVLLSYPRQSGKTVGTACYFLWKLLFNDDFFIYCLADSGGHALNIIKMIRTMIKNLPVWMQEGIVKMNEHEIEFENGSRIFASATGEDAGRSESANILYIDEMAFISRTIWNAFYAGASPIISSGTTTQIIMTSTPNGMNQWWQFVSRASTVDKNGKIVVKGKNRFVVKGIPWDAVPGRDEKYKQEIIAEFGVRYWESEYECKFKGSGGTLIDGDTLEKMEVKDPIYIKKIWNNEDFVFKIYERYHEEHRYVMFHDPAEGISEYSDFTAIDIFDVTNPFEIRQVASFQAKLLTTTEAPFVLYEIGKEYGFPKEFSETNKFKDIPANLVKDCDYPDVYFDDEKGRFGVYTTKATKPVGCSHLRRSVMKKNLVLVDSDTIQQLSVFVKKGDSYEADLGENDDHVMNCVNLAWFISDKTRMEEHIIDGEIKNYNKEMHDIPYDDDGIVGIYVSGNNGDEEWIG